MDFIGLDVGASGTRYVTGEGEISQLQNNICYVKEDEKIDLMPYNSDIESALDVTIETDNSWININGPIRVLIGELAERYSSVNVKTSVMQNKSDQPTTYISAVVATAISKLKKGLSDDIIAFVTLPPIEVRFNKEKFQNRLKGNYAVRFNKRNGVVIRFRIEEVEVFEESFMALVAYFFDENGAVKESEKYFASGNILSMDIGASTCDLVVCSNMRYLEKSGQTYKTGGNVAVDFLKDRIRALYGYDIPQEHAELVMAEGRIMLGNEYEDCREIVDQAKQELASQIVSEMQAYFRKVGIPIQTIRAIVVSGGGSMNSWHNDKNGKTKITTNPVSYYITSELNKVCAGVIVEQFPGNPRLANIQGLYIRAMFEMDRRIKEKRAKNDQERKITNEIIQGNRHLEQVKGSLSGDKDGHVINGVEGDGDEVKKLLPLLHESKTI